MKKLLFIFLLFASCYAAQVPMIVVDPPKFTMDLSAHYNSSLNTLNISDTHMTDSDFLTLFESIKTFIQTNKVQALLLENIGLTQIPYYVISFALLDPTLQYVSMQHNNFNLPSMSPDYAKQISYLVEDAVTHSEDNTEVPATSAAPAPNPTLPAPKLTAGPQVIVSVVQGLWGSVSADIENAIQTQNATSTTKFYKKVIIIDIAIPPILVVNQKSAAATSTTKSRCVYLLERGIFVSIGAAIALLPTILTYFYMTNASSC